MMDDRLEWTQNLGDTFLAQRSDVLVSIQRLRAMALKARILHSTAQQKVTGERNRIVIEPVVPQVLSVPFYDPRVAYGQWPHPIYPPMWWNPPRGYLYGSGVGFMTGVGIPAAFWRHGLDWDTGRLFVDNTVGFGDYNRVAGTAWVHDPQHRHFVSYSTPELRVRYGRDFASGRETKWSFRGYDVMDPRPAAQRVGRTHGRTVRMREPSNDAKAARRLNVFEDMDQGARERLFSRRGNESILAARRYNTHLATGDNEIAAAAAETDTVAAR
jgi:hypothetical protein